MAATDRRSLVTPGFEHVAEEFERNSELSTEMALALGVDNLLAGELDAEVGLLPGQLRAVGEMLAAVQPV